LHVAAHFGHAALVKALIEAGPDVNKLASPQYFFNDASGKRRKRTNVLRDVTPVFDGADQGHTHVVMELIKAGADVNQATSEGSTPLYIAAEMGHDGCVAVLIQAGADVRKADKTGWTPMQIATCKKREKVMTLLKFYERV
jgi:cytohesin